MKKRQTFALLAWLCLANASVLAYAKSLPTAADFDKKFTILGIASQCTLAYAALESNGDLSKSQPPVPESNHAIMADLRDSTIRDLVLSGYELGAISTNAMQFNKAALGKERWMEDMRLIADACDKIVESTKSS